MDSRNFTKTFLDYIKPGHKVLDFGAGEGNFTQMFLDRGAIVTAIDIRPPTFSDNKLIIKKMKIEDFCLGNNDEKYDFIFARNVIQFIDKNFVFETLFPWIEKNLVPQGIVAIETFYQDPEPPFNHPMVSLYALEELISYFMTWKEIDAKEYDHMGLDMSGQTRKFFVSSLIAQKTN